MSLEGSWTIETLAVGGELVRPLDGGKPLTLEIDGERVSGSTGVNRFVGGISDDGFFSNLTITRMAGPEMLMAQEAILLAHLESVDSIESSDSARLLLADGLIVLTLVPAGTNHILVTS